MRRRPAAARPAVLWHLGASTYKESWKVNALRFAGWGLREAAGRNLYLLATTTVAVAAWLGLAALAAPFLPATSHNDLNHVVIVSALARQELPLRFVDR